jgi:hypothetical protein
LNKEDFFQIMNIDPVAQEIVNDTEKKTGKSFVFVERKDLTTSASIKITRKVMPNHILFFKRENYHIMSHLIAHECGHIQRMITASDELKVVPVLTAENRRNAITKIMKGEEKLLELYKGDSIKIINMMIDGIIKQMTSQPVDVRIERWLYNSYPDLRMTQNESVIRDIKIALKGLSDRIRNSFPKLAFELSNIMNYAHIKSIDDLFGTRYSKQFEGFNGLDKGEKMYELLLSEDRGYSGDIEIINKWAKIAGIDGWITWQNFEDMPPDYENKI